MENRLRFWIRFLLPLFLALFLGILIFMMAQFREPPGIAWYAAVWFIGSVFFIWEAGWWVSKKLDQHIPWQKTTFKRLSIQLLSTNLIGISFFLICFLLLNYYENNFQNKDNPLSLIHILVAISEAFIIVQIINSIQISYQLLQAWQGAQLEAEIYKKQNIISRLDGIRQQIDPEFFNDSLKELQALLQQSPESVGQFLSELSKNYQDQQSLLDANLLRVQKVLDIKAEKETALVNTPPETYKSRFLVRTGNKLFLIPVNEIAVIYKDDINLLFTKSGKKYPVDHSLEELSRLLSPKRFFRINRQTIINLSYIREMRSESNQLLISLNIPFPETLAVSQRSISNFKKWLNEEA